MKIKTIDEILIAKTKHKSRTILAEDIREMLIEASEQAYKAATICIVNPQADEEQMFEYDESYYIHRFPTFKDYLKEINK